MSELYPGSYQVPAMKIWHLPDGKEGMFHEICESGEYFAEEKKDGAYYQFEKTDSGESYLFGRSASVKTGELSEKSANVPHIMSALDCLPNGTIVIGEIYYHGGTSKTTTTIMGCLPEEAIKRQEKRGKILYYLHDIIKYDGVDLIAADAMKRYRILEAIWKKHNLAQYSFLELAEAFDTDIEVRLAKILNEGGEGVVLRKKTAVYSPGKRPAWTTIKMKQSDTIDLVCCGFVSPTKEYTGQELESWPYWEIQRPGFYDCFEEDHCFAAWVPEKLVDTNQMALYRDYDASEESDRRAVPVTKPYYYGWKSAMRIGAYDDNGNLVELGTVASGLTDEDRERMATHPEEYLNKVFNFKCMSIDKTEKTLRHPVFVGLREDKDAKDCIIKEIFA